MIDLNVSLKSDLQINIDEINKIIFKIVEEEKKKLGEIEINIVGESELLEINKKYLNHNYHTDIITFDESFINTIAGSLYISYDYVNESAKKLNIVFRKEIFRIIIHGILHLCGYNDDTIEAKDQMTNREDHYLKIIE